MHKTMQYLLCLNVGDELIIIRLKLKKPCKYDCPYALEKRLIYVSKIRKIKNNMKERLEDPMINYRKLVKSPNEKLDIKSINMSELRKIYSKMRKSNTISADKISINTLIKLKISTQPIMLKLINQVIATGKFPQVLKTSHIIPIKKGDNLTN